MPSIRAIETRYAGHKFRSRLEARWAVFFDHLGIPWEYEAQGFEWGPQTVFCDSWTDGVRPIIGGKYLPDFWLPSIETWFEVKGQHPTEEEFQLHHEFAILTKKRHICAFGDIPTPKSLKTSLSDSMLMLNEDGGDVAYQWCLCPTCEKPGIEFSGRGERICDYHGAEHDDTDYGDINPIIIAAYDAARSARFEHGECGAT